MHPSASVSARLVCTVDVILVRRDVAPESRRRLNAKLHVENSSLIFAPPKKILKLNTSAPAFVVGR